MPMDVEEFVLKMLKACAARAPEPLYPARFAKEQNLDRDKLDLALEELRRRGLVHLTDWMKDLGQGYALTAAGEQALGSGRVPTGRALVAAAPTADRTLTEYQRGETVRNALFEPTTPYVSRILLAANLLFFAFGAVYAWNNDLPIGEYLAGSSSQEHLTTDFVLLRLGALDRVLVFSPQQVHKKLADYGHRPQFERIILSCFLHIGLLHLGMNMYFLFSLGPLIESMWGSVRFLAIYVVAGIVSGCDVLLLQPNQQQIQLTAGASGCLYGIFVALVVWFWLNRRYLPEQLIQDWSRNLATNAFLLLIINFLPGLSWQGHLGGAIGGLLAALLLHLERFHTSPAIRWLAMAGLPMIPLGFFLAVLWQAGYFSTFLA